MTTVEASPRTLRVALVCMPFASADRPSLQMGLLQAHARREGFETDVLQLNVDLAAELTPLLYEYLCERRQHMTGEWLFAYAAFGDDAPSSEEAYYEQFGHDFTWGEAHGLGLDDFTELRRTTLPAYIDRCLLTTDWSQYGVVGFSSMFQQNTASLALARRIKARHPEVKIIFGGANMEAEMGTEWARAFDFVDYVVRGEADDSFPRLLDAIDRGRRPLNLPGVVMRVGGTVVEGSDAVAIEDMDSLPVPHYDDYFERAAQLGLVEHYKRTWTLPYESSRGCWWGQKNHCTFCGLNGEGMGYRSKAPERVFDEIASLAHRYQICSFIAVDNILDVKYIRQLFGEIDRERLDFNFFYEVKSNLSRSQIQQLHRGGIRRVQPGIESLNSHVLTLMRKGATMLQNVRCMKWCRYYDIGVNWNLLWGFPGETEEDYKSEVEVMRLLTHLDPPVGSGRIWLERFSPHFEDPSFPVSNVTPEASYQYVYPAHVDLTKAAYFFDYSMEDTVSPDTRGPTNELLESWRASWESDRHSVTFRQIKDAILIDRNRGRDHQATICITGVGALVHNEIVETMRTPAQVAEKLAERGHRLDVDEVRGALDQFCSAGLALTEDDRYLSITLPQNPNW